MSLWSREALSATMYERIRGMAFAPVAQGIEHRFPKPGVARSNRAGGTTKDTERDGAIAVPLICSAWWDRAEGYSTTASPLLASTTTEAVASPLGSSVTYHTNVLLTSLVSASGM